MGKRKLKLELIKNNSARKNCLRMRKGGLIKKTEELSILCGVEACAIIHDGPNDLNPTVWPSLEEAQHVVNRFKNLPEMVKNKRMTNPEEYLKQKNKKLVEKIKQQQQLENREMEMTEIMYHALNGKGLGGMKKEDLDDLYLIIEKKEKEIENRIDALRKKTSVQQLTVGSNGMNVEPSQSLLMEEMNPHVGQQLPPPPPNGYNGGDAFVMPTPPPPNGYYGGDASVMLTPPPPLPDNGYYGGDVFVMPAPPPPPPPNGYYGGDLSVTSAPPLPNGYYGGDTSVMPTPPPSIGYYGGDAFVMPAPPRPPNGYYGGDLSVMPVPPPPNAYYGGDTSVMPTPPPSTDYYGGDAFVMPAPSPPPLANGYYGGDASVMPAPPPPNGCYGGDAFVIPVYDGYFKGPTGYYPLKND